MDEITKTQRRTASYWFSDGIAEIVGGVVLALIGAPMYLSVALENDALATGALFIMILGFPISAKVVRWVKDRITHPRTGYVKYPERSGKRRGVGAAIALVIGVGIALAAVLLRNEGFEGTLGYALTAGSGAALAAALAVRAHKMSMPRFYLSALAVAGGAAWSYAQGLSFIGALGVMWLVLGLVSVVTGTAALSAYVRQNPPQREPLHG
jgi:hypothetical protein